MGRVKFTMHPDAAEQNDFLDDLKPGDDKVRGPESITTLFNKEWNTDQW